MNPPATPALRTEFTVVLPQRHAARVVKVVPWRGRSVLIMLRDFVRKESDDEGPGRLEPIWRLYRYEPPGPVAMEVCVFTQPPREAVRPVFMATADGRVYLLFDDQLLRVDVEGRSVEGICRLQLPSAGNEPPEVRGFSARDNVVCLTIATGPDDLSVHWVPLGSDGAPSGAAYPGGRGERVAFGPHGDTYVLDMMDVYRFREGQLVGQRDFAALFGRWHRSPAELLSVGPDGRVFIGGSGQLLAVSADLSEVLARWALDGEPEDMAWADGTDTLLLSRSDPVSGTLLVRSVSV